MKILQNDIFGQKHDTKPEKEKKVSMAAPKSFPNISLKSGLSEAQTVNDFVLIHRVLLKRLMGGGLTTKQQREVFAKVVKNELSIKSGRTDTLAATRDSLLAFFGKR
ncbi:MAG: hypothetical protein IJ599_02235 [Alphaproteobacteria bacterium]|nr:hypothetical protein [Alphaproteobacteria bacterium]